MNVPYFDLKGQTQSIRAELDEFRKGAGVAFHLRIERPHDGLNEWPIDPVQRRPVRLRIAWLCQVQKAREEHAFRVEVRILTVAWTPQQHAAVG